jgi:2-hydroxychromene-2-carboxylate isomerase
MRSAGPVGPSTRLIARPYLSGYHPICDLCALPRVTLCTAAFVSNRRMSETLTVYIDYKSPYAYLAMEPTRALAREFSLSITWRPYSLQIQDYLGEVDTRNPHQWRRVKYSYMDARRMANERGLIVLGPQKLFDSTVSHVGMLYAGDDGAEVQNRYHDIVFERFFKRELNIEDPGAIANVLHEAGATVNTFQDILESEGRTRLDSVLKDAEDLLGIFGVPTYVIGNEIFWGGDRIPQVRRYLEQRA